MAGPTHANSGRSGRLYTHPVTGETALSVTTILGDGIPKKALPSWAARTAAEYAVEHISELAALVASGGELKKDALDRIKGAPWRQRDNKADIGTAVHDVAEKIALDGTGDVDLSQYDESIHGYLLSLIGWFEAAKPEVEMSEATVWNREFGYAGTLDLIARIPSMHDGGLQVLDFKTSKGIYGETALQIAAYANAEFILMDDGTEVEMPRPLVAGGAIHITPDGAPATLHPIEFTPALTSVFNHAITITNWTRDLSRTAVGSPIRFN